MFAIIFEQERLEKAKENYKRDMAQLWEQSEVGTRYQDCTFENYDRHDNEKAFEDARRYAEHFAENENGKGIVFTGSVGTGKTHLATAIARYCVEHYGASVYFRTFAQLLNEIRESYNTGEVIDWKYNDVDLLILDDLGKEKKTEWVDEKLYEILDNRYRDCKPVIITTNLSATDLSRYVDQAVMSRLIGSCEFILMNGKDHRRQK